MSLRLPPRPTAIVRFRLGKEWGKIEGETVWAYDLGKDRYRIENCPFYVDGVSLGDVVFAPLDPVRRFPTFERVILKSGNRTLRVLFDEPFEAGNRTDCALRRLVELGCGYEGSDHVLFAVNVPPGADLAAVRDHLDRQASAWECADPVDDEVLSRA